MIATTTKFDVLPLEVMRSVGASVWRPPREIPLSEWCVENFRLSPALEASSGHFNLEDNPFWADIIDAFMDPFVRQITVKKSTQVGGTLTLQAVAWALSVFDPAPSMVVGPDEVYCNELKERIYANGEESPTLRERVPPERLRNSRHIDFGSCRAYLAWAGSAQRLRGRPCKRVFRSEIDVYPKNPPKGGNPIQATANRVKRFYDSTIYDESSPWGDDSVVDKLYDAGHRARWVCKCPHCGTRQDLRFFVYKDGKHAGCGGIGGLRDESGNFLVPDAVKDAFYVCLNGCRIDQDQKTEFVKSGKWVAEGQRIVNDEVIGEPAKGRRHLSYHLWAIHSPITTFKDLAVTYLAARRDSTLREFWENWLGLKYESRRKLPDWKIIGERLSAGHQRGFVPQRCWFLTAGVDVQDDGCYYVVRGWGDMATSWLIEWGYLRRYDSEDYDPKLMTEEQLNKFYRSDIKQLDDAVLNRYFPVMGGGKNPLGRERLRPRLVLCDSNHRTREVHAYVSQHEAMSRRIRACRGDHRTKPSERWRVTEVERPARGGPAYSSTRQVTQIFTPHYKEAIAEKVYIPCEGPGSFNFFAGVVSSSSDYLRQAFNEHLVDAVDKTTGRNKTQWKVKNPQWGNHLGDCEVYLFAAAEIVLHEMKATWDASTWIVPKNESLSRLAGSIPTAAVRDTQLM